MKRSLYYIKITAVLLVIASVTALLLAFVNKMTVDVIAKNAEDERNIAIAELFDGMDRTESIERDLPDGVVGAYRVLASDGTLLGFCVDVNSYGYGSDPINMLVALSPDGKVSSVKVLSHSETPGLGSKAADGEGGFLSQFAGKSGALAVKKDGGEIDAVAGATVSSRAITSGVSLALSLGLSEEGGM